MKLQKPFCRLPVRFDVERMRNEVEALPVSAWSKHPSNYAGNSALRLITANGGENDDVVGEMKPTANLARCPYVQQVFASFGVVWSRARLMKLAPRSVVPPHCDVNYHWYHRVRIHIPIVTFPEVTFFCGGQTVHMGTGEAWIFDNWRPHKVDNPTDFDRIHLVADTMGNEEFFNSAGRGQWDNFEGAEPANVQFVPYRAILSPELLTERFNSSVVMPPAELESLVGMLSSDLVIQTDTPESRVAIVMYRHVLRGFCSEWRQLWSLFGDSMSGWTHYANLRKQLRDRIAGIQAPIYLRSNQILANKALNAGVLQHVLNPPGAEEIRDPEYADQPQSPLTTDQRAPFPPRRLEFHRPIFIVAAPRTGSTLLFETLAQSSELWTLGGEAHSLIEQYAALRPSPGGVDSNRLTAEHLTSEIASDILKRLAKRVRNARAQSPSDGATIRMLEKTPKNALRIPFFRALFPDAQFVYLWRDPRENLSSIMEAWRSGGFVTYPSLDGSMQPWSLLLPPGWREQRERPLEEIAAFQWRVTNEIILRDLSQLPHSDWLSLNYADLLSSTEREIHRVCDFVGIPFDDGLRARVSQPLPLSRHTHTAPQQNKWHKNEAEILNVLPSLEATWKQLRALTADIPVD